MPTVLHLCPYCRAVVDAQAAWFWEFLGPEYQTCKTCGLPCRTGKAEWSRLSRSKKIRHHIQSWTFSVMAGFVGGLAVAVGLEYLLGVDHYVLVSWLITALLLVALCRVGAEKEILESKRREKAQGGK